MAKNKIFKAVSAGLVTSAVAAGAVTPAFAGQLLGQTDFNKGIGLPWHTCESGAQTKLQFNVSGGTYNVTIINPGGAERDGESWWDAQFRHRKLTIVNGHQYEVSYEMTPDRDGAFKTKIGNQAGDVEEWHNKQDSGSGVDNGQAWDAIKVTKGTKYTFKGTFTAMKADSTANGGWEWAFHFGGKGEYNTTGDAFPANYGTATNPKDTTTLKFDNMSLIDKTDNKNDWAVLYGEFNPYENQIHNAVRVNQVGYYTNLRKRATVVLADNDTKSYPFTIVNKSGTVVYSGNTTSGKGKTERDSGQNYAIIDFTEFTTKGDGYVIKMGSGYTAPEAAGVQKTKIGSAESYPFSIGDNIYTDAKSQKNLITTGAAGQVYDSQNMFTDAFNYFYQNRATISLSSSYITSGDKTKLASRGSASALDTAEIQKLWIASYGASYPGTGTGAPSGKNLTAKYGWFDAGDHGKYVVNGGIAAWTLANTFEMAKVRGTEQEMDSLIKIPGLDGTAAASASIPKALQEVQVELEFFIDMMVKSDHPDVVKYDLNSKKNGSAVKGTGMVYHKLHDYKWTALGVKPADDDLDRIVKPATTAATLNAAATLAQGARLFKPYDATLAAKYLDAAKTTYQAAKDHPDFYAPLDQAIGGGAYGDDNVKDDFYWAACELFVTTGDAAYKTDLESFTSGSGDTKQEAYKLVYNLSGGENNGSFTSFNWGNTAGLGTLSLWLNKDKIDASKVTVIEDSIKAVADAYLNEQSGQGYAIPYRGAPFTDPINKPGIEFFGYEWGSNSFVINNAIVMAYAYDISKNTKYINGTVEAMDYLLGRNAMDFSYITGYGSFHLVFPHHRFWAPETDKEFPYAPAGVLSGGANIGMQDPYIGGAGLDPTETPSQFAYIDSAESWSTNEVTINWNAPLVWILKYLNDVAPTAKDDPNTSGTTTTKTSTTTTTTTTTTTATGTTTTPGPGGTTTTFAPNPGGTKYGDVNLDGNVTAADLVILVKAASGKTKLTGQALINAGCSKADGIDTSDMLALIKFLVNRNLVLPL